MTRDSRNTDHSRPVTCEVVQDWVWGVRLATEPPTEPIQEHLDDCEPCQDELDAREELEADLRGLRVELSTQPPPKIDGRVLAAAANAVADRESGAYPPVAEAPAPVPVAVPAATPLWMTVAAALLACAVGLGFVAGRFTATGTSGFASGSNDLPIHTTLATAAGSGGAQVDWRNMHRPHQVGISPDGLTRLQDGRTYLMTGPVGGPYQVVGAVQFEQVEMPSDSPRGTVKEIVVAVGPQGGWKTGRELALADLSAQGAEILGRRAVEDPPVRVGWSAP